MDYLSSLLNLAIGHCGQIFCHQSLIGAIPDLLGFAFPLGFFLQICGIHHLIDICLNIEIWISSGLRIGQRHIVGQNWSRPESPEDFVKSLQIVVSRHQCRTRSSIKIALIMHANISKTVAQIDEIARIDFNARGVQSP